MALKFCPNLSMMFCEESSLLKRYALAKTEGFSDVEFGFPYEFTPEELSKEKNLHGINQVLINCYPGDSLGFAALQGRKSEFMESLRRSVEYCKALDCKRLHIMSGKSSPEFPGCAETLLENLRAAAPTLEESDITGLIEPINNYSVPGYFLNNYETAEKIIKEISSPNIRLQLDIFHLQFLCGNLTNNIKRFMPITGHVQVAQVPDRNEPDSFGEINYQHIFKTILDCGYQGWIGLEYKPKGLTQEGLGWLRNYI